MNTAKCFFGLISSGLFSKLQKLFYSAFVLLFAFVLAYLSPEEVSKIYFFMAVGTVSVIFVHFFITCEEDDLLMFILILVGVISIVDIFLVTIVLWISKFNSVLTFILIILIYMPACITQVLNACDESDDEHLDPEKYGNINPKKGSFFVYLFYNVFLTVLPFLCISKLFQNGLTEFRSFTIFSYCVVLFILFLDEYGRRNWESSFFWKSE